MTEKKNNSYEIPNDVLQSIPSPKITVRTLAYNHASYIRDCIESVLMQETSFPFEYIIAEDNSTDGTREIVLEYAQNHPGLIRVITSGENVGSIANLYRADIHARGEYIAICEGDDYWTDPKKLEKQVSMMEADEDCHLSFHPVLVEWMGTDLEKEVYKRHKKDNYLFPVEKLIVEGGEFCPTGSIIFKRESREILGEWLTELPVGDYFTQVTAALNGGALYIDEVMGVYRKGVEGSWSMNHNNFIKICEHSLKMVSAIRQFDHRTGYKYHKSFRQRENHFLKKYSVFKAFSYDTQTVDKVKSLINSQTKGFLKIKCYLYLIFSFLYYRLNFKKLFLIKNQILGKIQQY